MDDPEALRRLIEALAREDAQGLVDEARALARERVRDRLAAELERLLLDEVALAGSAPADPRAPRTEPSAPPGEPSEPSPSPRASGQAEPTSTATGDAEPGRGVYLYAVVDRVAEAGLPGGVRGVGETPVRVLPDGSVQAIVSDVPLEDFADDALRRNLNDLPWLSETAVAHEAVVDAALAVATVVPMRLCTIFHDDDAVRDMLARERPVLEGALARLRGTSEWGVKVVADRSTVADAVARRSERVRRLRETAGEAGEGAGYLAGRQLERLTQQEIDAELDVRTRTIHEALGALATDARINPASNRDLAGYTGDMVLNAAYLVPDARRAAFRERAESLAGEHRDDGLDVQLTGPWPPYNFSTMAGSL